nr:hypothetical protein [Caldilineaceae bacterium]
MSDSPAEIAESGPETDPATSGMAESILARTGWATRSMSPWVQRAITQPGVPVPTLDFRSDASVGLSSRHTYGLLHRIDRQTQRNRIWEPNIGSLRPELFQNFAAKLDEKHQQFTSGGRFGAVPEINAYGAPLDFTLFSPFMGAVRSTGGGGRSQSRPAPAASQEFSFDEVLRMVDKHHESSGAGGTPPSQRGSSHFAEPAAAPRPAGPAALTLPPGSRTAPPRPNRPAAPSPGSSAAPASAPPSVQRKPAQGGREGRAGLRPASRIEEITPGGRGGGKTPAAADDEDGPGTGSDLDTLAAKLAADLGAAALADSQPEPESASMSTENLATDNLTTDAPVVPETVRRTAAQSASNPTAALIPDRPGALPTAPFQPKPASISVPPAPPRPPRATVQSKPSALPIPPRLSGESLGLPDGTVPNSTAPAALPIPLPNLSGMDDTGASGIDEISDSPASLPALPEAEVVPDLFAGLDESAMTLPVIPPRIGAEVPTAAPQAEEPIQRAIRLPDPQIPPTAQPAVVRRQPAPEAERPQPAPRPPVSPAQMVTPLLQAVSDALPELSNPAPKRPEERADQGRSRPKAATVQRSPAPLPTQPDDEAGPSSPQSAGIMGRFPVSQTAQPQPPPVTVRRQATISAAPAAPQTAGGDEASADLPDPLKPQDLPDSTVPPVQAASAPQTAGEDETSADLPDPLEPQDLPDSTVPPVHAAFAPQTAGGQVAAEMAEKPANPAIDNPVAEAAANPIEVAAPLAEAEVQRQPEALSDGPTLKAIIGQFPSQAPDKPGIDPLDFVLPRPPIPTIEQAIEPEIEPAIEPAIKPMTSPPADLTVQRSPMPGTRPPAMIPATIPAATPQSPPILARPRPQATPIQRLTPGRTPNRAVQNVPRPVAARPALSIPSAMPSRPRVSVTSATRSSGPTTSISISKDVISGLAVGSRSAPIFGTLVQRSPAESGTAPARPSADRPAVSPPVPAPSGDESADYPLGAAVLRRAETSGQMALVQRSAMPGLGGLLTGLMGGMMGGGSGAGGGMGGMMSGMMGGAGGGMMSGLMGSMGKMAGGGMGGILTGGMGGIMSGMTGLMGGGGAGGGMMSGLMGSMGKMAGGGMGGMLTGGMGGMMSGMSGMMGGGGAGGGMMSGLMGGMGGMSGGGGAGGGMGGMLTGGMGGMMSGMSGLMGGGGAGGGMMSGLMSGMGGMTSGMSGMMGGGGVGGGMMSGLMGGMG